MSVHSTSSLRFDYVVAGAGSAGCLLAARLSEDPANRVCLIEAGPRERSPLIRVPLGFVILLARQYFSWRYMSEPMAHLGGRRIAVPRGKVLGGTSAINGMVYMRGHPGDYDDWAEDNPGWSFREIMPYFLRLENNCDYTDSPYHGTGGPVNVMKPLRPSPLSGLFLEGARSLGYDTTVDPNGPVQEGFHTRQVTQARGLRGSSSTIFLRPAMNRPNIEVKAGVTVDKVIVENGRATGLSCLDGDGRRFTIEATKEIVLSGGAFGSPAILERSGIGDGERLNGLGIEVVRHLPGVGRNLQDHSTVGLQYMAPGAPGYGISLRGLLAGAVAAGDYALFRRGMFATNLVEVGAFVRTSPEQERPDVQFSFIPARRGNGGEGYFGIGHGYCMTAILLRPHSRGTSFIADLDPGSAPRIDLNILSDARDTYVLAEAVKLARTYVQTPPFRKLLSREEVPGEAVVSDAEILHFVRGKAGTGFHPVGTCRMGSGPEAVVDSELRVHGMDGLRVADASIMPTIIGGNTNIPTFAIADKAADMILGRVAPAPWTHPDPRARDVAAAPRKAEETAARA